MNPNTIFFIHRNGMNDHEQPPSVPLVLVLFEWSSGMAPEQKVSETIHTQYRGGHTKTKIRLVGRCCCCCSDRQTPPTTTPITIHARRMKAIPT